MKLITSIVFAMLTYVGSAPCLADSFSWPGATQATAIGLNSSLEKERLQAIEALALQPLSQAEAWLIPLFSDKSARVRQRAAEVLITNGSTKAALSLTRWLDMPSPKDKIEAAKLLRITHDPSVLPRLLRSLDDTNADVLVAILETLSLFESNDSTFKVAQKLDHSNPKVRKAAAKAIHSFRSPRAKESLVGCVEDNDRHVAALCIEGLRGTKHSLGIMRIVEQTRSTVPSLRRLAIEVLGTLDSPLAMNTLWDLVDFPDPSLGQPPIQQKIKFRAETAQHTALTSLVAMSIFLSKTSPKRAKQLLNRMVPYLKRRDLPFNLAKALKPAQHLLAGSLASLLDDPRLVFTKDIVDLMSFSGNSSALPALFRELEKNRLPSGSVFEAIAAISSSDALPDLLELIGSQNRYDRQSILKAINSSAAFASPGSEIMTALLPTETIENKDTILQIITKIGYSPTPQIIETLALAPTTPTRITMLAINTLAALKTSIHPKQFYRLLENVETREATSEMLVALAPQESRRDAKRWLKTNNPFYKELGAKILLSQECSGNHGSSLTLFEKMVLNDDPSLLTIGFAGLSQDLPPSIVSTLLRHSTKRPPSYTSRLLEASIHWKSTEPLLDFIELKIRSQEPQIKASAYYALAKHKLPRLKETLADGMKSPHSEVALNASYAALKQNVEAVVPMMMTHSLQDVRHNANVMATLQLKDHSVHATTSTLKQWKLITGLPVKHSATSKSMEYPMPLVCKSPTDGAFSFQPDTDGRFFSLRSSDVFTVSTLNQVL